MRMTRVRAAALGAALAGVVALALPIPVAAATANPTPARVGTTAPAWSDPNAADDHSSIFAADQPELAGSGWATCAAPISWRVDLGSLPAPAAREAVADLTWAFDTWAAASGLTFAFAGTTSYGYDDATFTLTPTAGPAATGRHIDVAFVADSATDRLSAQIVGLGSPSQVLSPDNEIVGGTAVFRASHARTAAGDQARSLYLHEIGHVLGLAHAHSPANVMYPTVDDQVSLGTGDVNGVRDLVKECRTAGA